MKSIKDRYWRRPLPFIPTKQIVEQANELKVSPEIIQIIHNRGIKDTDSISRFLYPSLNDLAPPSELKGIKRAAEIIDEIITHDGEIIIWGDYDVDGVTSTSLLVLFFKHFTQNVQWFIPNRFSQGYGLHGPTLKKIIKNCTTKYTLLITVDCGIHDHKEVSLAHSLGCKIIVTDHHVPGDDIVKADVVINPKQKNCHFEDDTMAGVGLAFYLAAGFRSYMREKNNSKENYVDLNMKQFLDLVAIGTVADMVSLKGANRILVRAGFEVLNSNPNPGIAALCRECDIHKGNITSEDISFQIAPKINAAGRLADASIAVELFLQEDEKECAKIAKNLTRLNNKRKEECNSCLEYALSIIGNEMICGEKCAVFKIDYSLGVLGVVASQLLEKIRAPVIIVTQIDDETYGKVLKGSCRSIAGVNIIEVLDGCSEYLLQHGGHEMAAGITLLPENFAAFKETFSKKILQIPEKKISEREIDIELEMEKALSLGKMNAFHLLEPYGIDNDKPKFLDSGVILSEIKKIGKNGDHITLSKRGKYTNSRCVAFGFGGFEHILREKPVFDVIYTISLSRFKKAEKWQAHVFDII